MANMTKNSSGNWVYNSTDNNSHTLATNGTHLDGNIIINGAGALASSAGSGSVSSSGLDLVSTSALSGNNITVSGSGSGSVSCGTGWKVSETKNVTSSSSTKYVKGVSLTAPTSGTRQFYIQVPNGSGTTKFIFNVDSSGNVTVTES